MEKDWDQFNKEIDWINYTETLMKQIKEFDYKKPVLKSESDLDYSDKFREKYYIFQDLIKINPKENLESKKDSFDSLKIFDENPEKPLNIAVIYHHQCFDGSYSAINAYIYYNYMFNKKIKLDFIPV